MTTPLLPERRVLSFRITNASLIAWENRDHWAKLDVDFSKIRALVTYSKTS